MSGKLTIPKKNNLAGLKVFCMTCKTSNPKCKHYGKHRYRMHVHVAGTEKGRVTKVLSAMTYGEAYDEAYKFKKQMEDTNFERPKATSKGNNYTLPSAILKYRQYLDGKHHYRHLQKKVGENHRDESVRYCRFFAEVLKGYRDISVMPVTETTPDDVSNFYAWCESKYSGVTHNKAMSRVKAFYDFLIKVEKIQMENPFETYVSQPVQQNKILTLSRAEFDTVCEAVETADRWKYDSKGGKKNMYWPQLQEAFKLFLLTGCRREEVLTLRWSDILIHVDGVKFFVIANRKVMRSVQTKRQNRQVKPKLVPINQDLLNLLDELGYKDKKGSDDYIIYENATVTRQTLMDRVSKSFTHYREAAGIQKQLNLADLRKTYLTWLHVVMQKQTGLLSSHTSHDVLDRHYLDPSVLSAVEKAALNLVIFGT